MTRTFRTEFPELGELPEALQLLAAGWSDRSWHNNACPSFGSPCGTFELFVDGTDPEQRETECRFLLQVIEESGEWFVTSDDWTAITAELAARGLPF